jgi:hypothetical protein
MQYLQERNDNQMIVCFNQLENKHQTDNTHQNNVTSKMFAYKRIINKENGDEPNNWRQYDTHQFWHSWHPENMTQ